MDMDYVDFDRIQDPEIRKVVLAHRNSRTPDPCLAVDGNLYTRRMSSCGAEALTTETNDEPKKEEGKEEKK